MNLQSYIEIYGGGPGSGCNPDAGHCGRPPGSGEGQIRDEEMASLVTALNANHFTSFDMKQGALEELKQHTDKALFWKLASAVRMFTENGTKKIRQETLDCLQQRDCKEDGKTILTALQNAPEIEYTLYRGMVVDDETYEAFRMMPVGHEMDVPLSSSSSERHIAEAFVSQPMFPLQRKGTIMFEIENAKGVSARLLSSFPTEKEVIIGGRFTVTYTRQTGKNLRIKLTQTGVFNAKG